MALTSIIAAMALANFRKYVLILLTHLHPARKNTCGETQYVIHEQKFS